MASVGVDHCPQPAPEISSGAASPTPAGASSAGQPSEALAGRLWQLRPALQAAIAAVDQGDGWAPLGQEGTWLLKHDPSCDARNFCFKKLNDLVRAQNHFDLKTVLGSQGAHLYVRAREG